MRESERESERGREREGEGERERVEPHLRSDVKSIRAWTMAASRGTRINLPESRHSKPSKI